MPNEWRELLSEIIDIGRQDIYSNAPEYEERVRQMHGLIDRLNEVAALGNKATCRFVAETILLRDTGTDATVAATIEADTHGIAVRFEGYGDHGSAEGFGWPVLIELHDGELTIHVWADIGQEDPTHVISLENARESLRS